MGKYTSNAKRVAWIDVARGVGILAVVLFHTGFLPFLTVSEPVLMSFMLPVFLFTGGWLVRDRPLDIPHFFSTVKRLLAPFFLAGGVSFLGWLVLRHVYPQQVLLQPVAAEMTKWLTGRNPYFDSPLWFIPTYLFATLFMQLIAPWWGRRGRVTQMLLGLDLVLLGFLLARTYVYPVFSYDLVALFVGMMMLGSAASQVHLPRHLQTTWADVTAVCLFVATALANGYIDIFQREFGNPFLYLASAVLGTYVVSRLAGRVFAPLGRSSMAVLVWHWPLMQWLTYGLYSLGILAPLTASYAKTSFALRAGGAELVLLQLVFCALYTAVPLYVVVRGRDIMET